MQRKWLDRLSGDDRLAAVCGVKVGEVMVAEGVWGSSAHLAAGAVAKRSGKPVLLVVAHLDDADEAAADLALYEGLGVTTLAALEVMPGETNVSLEQLAERLSVVTRLRSGDQPDVVVAPVQALMQAVPADEAIGQMVLELERGQTLGQAALLKWMEQAGYQRMEAVDQVGDFAVRGGIVDVYPPGDMLPVRLDFFGDQIDTIAEIDLDSMGSDRQLERTRLIGASSDAIQSNEQTASFLTLLREDTVVVLCELLEVSEQARGYYERLTDPRGIFSPQSVLATLRDFACIEMNQFANVGTGRERVALPVERLINFENTADKAVGELAAFAMGTSDQAQHEVVVLCSKPAEQQRLEQLLQEHVPEAAGLVGMEVGYLHRGFVWGADRQSGTLPLMIVPHHELFHRYQTRRRLRRVSATRGAETFFDLDVGDYVVHVDHGIALFRGLRTMRKEAASEEYLTLEFADRALLHVPASQIELVQKYVGGFAGRPPLSKLGGKRWAKQKEQVKEAVRDLAKELLQVQAARASLPGIRYPDDSPWMHQFEAEFPYDETEDQLASIAAVKKDMTGDQPMGSPDLRGCGLRQDGIAMRAAFKAVAAGKQVAVLCPTTVLCEQHERTFRQRMADYPVRIESLSRFKTGAQAAEICAGLRTGSVDLVIGTHRLLSEDIGFKELGLVIVDEEQRFGVEHKNRLMRYRVTVDVLTLSATPIPRTLHMALLGLRDISSLSTPPADRRAIVTEVVPYDRQRIRTAILRELNRDGQCYFVHNRVHNIHNVANELRSLVPEARFVVGHGQMKGRELEEVMLKFIRGEADVLVCTTIIESGLDIPTANTMFIADADHFGLAEMHQLRGRVGRYKHRAYCYLLLPKERPLSEVAARRLRAIEEFSMLGAGFKIAMRDMEIRGVGNLLGAEQSGHIAAVGYQMYCRLLEEAAAELQQEDHRSAVDAHLELGIAGQIPKSYIPSDLRRMEVYRRISRARDVATLDDVEKSLADAYGKLPERTTVLLELAQIRVGLAKRNVEALKLHERDLIFTTRDVQPLYEALADAPGSVRLVDPPTDGKPGNVFYRPPENYLDPPTTLLAVLRKLLVRPLRQPA
jgi:transcription-repair coupling factor (superfamily II helicase)